MISNSLQEQTGGPCCCHTYFWGGTRQATASIQGRLGRKGGRRKPCWCAVVCTVHLPCLQIHGQILIQILKVQKNPCLNQFVVIVNFQNGRQVDRGPDDTNLVMSNRNFDCLMSEADRGLKEFSNWFKIKKLSLNVKKSNFMIFSCKRKYRYTQKVHP